MTTEQLQDAKKLAAAKFLKRTPSVVAVGIGNKEIDDEDTGIPCVRIYVSRLFQVNELSLENLVPPEILGVPTDVIVLAPAFFNPLSESPIAVAAAAPNLNPILKGALGAVVESRGTRYILGTNHSLAANGRVPADQPVKLDPSGARIGTTLAGRFVELRHGERSPADCALAQLDELPLDMPRPFIIDGPDKVDVPKLGQRVQKGGPGPSGTIVDESVDFFVDYSFGTFLLANQVFVKGSNGDFARQGDSGAILVANDTKKAVAMVFASAGIFTAACPLIPAFEALGLKPEMAAPTTQQGSARTKSYVTAKGSHKGAK